MTTSEIIHQRLYNQGIAAPEFTTPAQVVFWMGAMQAQEFAMAGWAIGLRASGITNADVVDAFNKGLILRTHLLRPTWHFVSPRDIRWLLSLTAPRVHAANAYSYRKFELDNTVLKKCHAIFSGMLSGGNHLTRDVLNEEMLRKNIVAKGLRLGYIFMHAELEGLICSGPRDGKQFTYALLEERVPPVPVLSREEALVSLASRYFASRGPATIHDFVYWSGLTVKEAKEGVEGLSGKFDRVVSDKKEYVFLMGSIKKSLDTFLMPDYDEYGMSYKDRSALTTSKKTVRKIEGNPEYKHWMVVNGAIEGTWEKTEKGKKLFVETFPFTSLSGAEKEKVRKAEKRFLAFVNG